MPSRFVILLFGLNICQNNRILFVLVVLAKIFDGENKQAAKQQYAKAGQPNANIQLGHSGEKAARRGTPSGGKVCADSLENGGQSNSSRQGQASADQCFFIL